MKSVVLLHADAMVELDDVGVDETDVSESDVAVLSDGISKCSSVYFGVDARLVTYVKLSNQSSDIASGDATDSSGRVATGLAVAESRATSGTDTAETF